MFVSVIYCWIGASQESPSYREHQYGTLKISRQLPLDPWSHSSPGNYLNTGSQILKSKRKKKWHPSDCEEFLRPTSRVTISFLRHIYVTRSINPNNNPFLSQWEKRFLYFDTFYLFSLFYYFLVFYFFYFFLKKNGGHFNLKNGINVKNSKILFLLFYPVLVLFILFPISVLLVFINKKSRSELKMANK